MRAVLAAVIGLVAVGVSVVPATRADEPQPSPPAPSQRTTVNGTVPAGLIGRWLVVGRIKVGSGGERNVPSLFEIARRNDGIVLDVRFADLPADQKAAVETASEAEQEWVPAPADLAAIAGAWDQLQPLDAKVAEVQTEIVGPDAFDEAMKGEAMTRDALWVIRQSQIMDQAAAPLLRQAAVYAVRAAEGGGYQGDFSFVMLAAAPFPIPITLTGRFDFYPLQPPGLVARLLDVFRGCGRARH